MEGMRHSLRCAAALAVLMLPAGAGAQEAVHSGYPNVNQPAEIAPGESVRLLSRILVDRSPGMRSVRRMDFYYATPIAASDAGGRSAQAERAAQAFGPTALEAGARTLGIAICDSDACARRAEPPRVWYLFELRAGNVWKPVRN